MISWHWFLSKDVFCLPSKRYPDYPAKQSDSGVNPLVGLPFASGGGSEAGHVLVAWARLRVKVFALYFLVPKKKHCMLHFFISNVSKQKLFIFFCPVLFLVHFWKNHYEIIWSCSSNLKLSFLSIFCRPEAPETGTSTSEKFVEERSVPHKVRKQPGEKLKGWDFWWKCRFVLPSQVGCCQIFCFESS